MAEYSSKRVEAFVRIANDYYDWKSTLSDLGLNEYRDLGGRLEMKCPFHEDKRPSFSISLDRKTFHCFSCGRSGSIVYFMYLLRGRHMSFNAFCENLLRQDKHLHAKLGVSTLKVKYSEIASAFEGRRTFNRTTVLGTDLSYSTLYRRLSKCGRTWEVLAMSLTLMQGSISNKDVCDAIERLHGKVRDKDGKLVETATEEVSLMDIINKE